jgi:hypothetical protein
MIPLAAEMDRAAAELVQQPLVIRPDELLEHPLSVPDTGHWAEICIDSSSKYDFGVIGRPVVR